MLAILLTAATAFSASDKTPANGHPQRRLESDAVKEYNRIKALCGPPQDTAALKKELTNAFNDPPMTDNDMDLTIACVCSDDFTATTVDNWASTDQADQVAGLKTMCESDKCFAFLQGLSNAYGRIASAKGDMTPAQRAAVVSFPRCACTRQADAIKLMNDGAFTTAETDEICTSQQCYDTLKLVAVFDDDYAVCKNERPSKPANTEGGSSPPGSSSSSSSGGGSSGGGSSGGSDPCFSKSTTTACKLLDAAATAEDAYGACYKTKNGAAEAVLMATLAVGDKVLTTTTDGGLEITRVLALHHSSVELAAKMLTITTSDGTKLSLTPEHGLFIDGALAAAADAKVGSALARADGAAVKIAHIATAESAAVINPVTAAGTILASDAGAPVLAASHLMKFAPLYKYAASRALVNAAVYLAGDETDWTKFVATVVGKAAAALAVIAVGAKALHSQRK